ncbi:MAG: DUF58 domain-containing protein [Chloroflexota bacterium]
MTVHVRLNSYLLPALTIGAFIMELIDPSMIWRALAIVFGGMWLIGWMWARSLSRHLRLTREMRFLWAQVGDKLEEQFTLTNSGILPATWIELVDHSTLPGYTAARAISAEGNETNSWHTNGACTRRGIYQLGGTTLRSGDPFGIYTVEVHWPECSKMVVMPPIIPLSSIDIMPVGGMSEGRPRPNLLEQTVNASSVRQYVQGDSMKLIHWPTTARHNQFYTRLMDGSPAGNWWIALDVDSNVQAGDDPESTIELGVILAASLADRGMRAHYSVGLLASGMQTAWLPPRSGEHHRLEILRALAVIERGHMPLAELLEHAIPVLGQRNSLIMITPSVSSNWVSLLPRLQRRGIRPTVILMDPASFGSVQRADALAEMLAEMGIPRFILDRSLLQQPEARPGWRGQWEWRITPTGKAIALHPPGDLSWKRLG